MLHLASQSFGTPDVETLEALLAKKIAKAQEVCTRRQLDGFALFGWVSVSPR